MTIENIDQHIKNENSFGKHKKIFFMLNTIVVLRHIGIDFMSTLPIISFCFMARFQCKIRFLFLATGKNGSSFFASTFFCHCARKQPFLHYEIMVLMMMSKQQNHNNIQKHKMCEYKNKRTCQNFERCE